MESFNSASARREFEGFVADASPSLMRTAYLLTWNMEESEDLVQETLLRIAKHWLRVKKMEYPGPYARRILVHLALRRANTRETPTALLNPNELIADEHSERAFHEIDSRSEVVALLGSLSRRQRAVLVLRYYEDLSEGEIARQLGWPIGTVKSTTSRALQQLRQMSTRASEHVAAPSQLHISLRNGASHDQSH